MLYQIKPYLKYVVLLVALSMLLNNRYPSANFLTGLAFLAIYLHHH